MLSPLSSEKKGRSCCYAKLLTAQVFQPIPGVGWTSISGSTRCKENGELQLLAISCNAEQNCHDSGHAELVLGCMCARFAMLLLVFSDSSTSQCNTLKPIIRLVWFSDSYPGSRWAGKERAWYPLFAHALNFPGVGNYCVISVKP